MFKQLVIFVSILVLLHSVSSKVFAQSSILEVLPSKADIVDELKLDIKISGNGDRFNAAESTVSISENLHVTALTLGNCNFSFLKTPTPSNLSFSGIILSDSAENCTVYSMTVVPVKKGTGQLSFTQSSVKRFGDAADILKTSVNGEYILSNEVSVQPTTTEVFAGSYDVEVTIQQDQNTVAEGVTVILAGVGGQDKKELISDQSGQVRFTDIESGIYELVVQKQNQQIAKQIINLEGDTSLLAFTINLENHKLAEMEEAATQDSNTENNNNIWFFVMVGIVAGVAITFGVMKLVELYKAKSS